MSIMIKPGVYAKEVDYSIYAPSLSSGHAPITTGNTGLDKLLDLVYTYTESAISDGETDILVQTSKEYLDESAIDKTMLRDALISLASLIHDKHHIHVEYSLSTVIGASVMNIRGKLGFFDLDHAKVARDVKAWFNGGEE